MWIEEMFADFKKHGFDLENTMSLLSAGIRTIRSGLQHFVDRKDRRDLNIFQIGLHYIDRSLLHSLSFSLSLCSL